MEINIIGGANSEQITLVPESPAEEMILNQFFKSVKNLTVVINSDERMFDCVTLKPQQGQVEDSQGKEGV